MLEGLNDPENLGAVARSARAFGIGGLVLDPTCIDPYYRRTIRVSMGEVLFLPVARAAAVARRARRAARRRLRDLGPDARPGAEPLWSLAVPDRVAVLLGAEGPGLSAATMAAATRRVRIPIAAGVDSLNVGHAAAVAFAHLARLRSQEPDGAERPPASSGLSRRWWPGRPAPGRNVVSSALWRAAICSIVVAIALAAPSWAMILLITARLAPPISSAWFSCR